MRPRTDRKRIVASQTARLQVFGGYLLLSGVLVSLGLAIPAMPTEHAAAWFDLVALCAAHRSDHRCGDRGVESQHAPAGESA